MSGPRAILNVNDDEATRYLVTRVLRQAGYVVAEAATGRDALTAAQQRRPGLIVLDVKLPDMSGLDVCRLLKSDPQTSSIPVLQTSATFTSAERRVEGLESGADGYLSQPIEAPELVATVRALLRAHDAEAAIRQLAQEWRRTFDAIGDALAVVDADGRVIRANDAMLRLLGVPAEAVAGGRLDALLGAEDAIDPVVDAVRRSGTREYAEVGLRGRILRVVADPLRDPDDPHERVVVVLTDITDLKRLEDEQRQRAEQLTEQSHRKDEFLAMLAHELRNPLNAIAAANGLEERTGPQDAQSRRVRQTVGRHVRQLARLIDDLLEVSRITRGTVQLQRRPLDLVEVVQQAVDACHARVDGRGQQVEISLGREPLPVLGDPLRIEQILTNVIENACKYSDPGSTIWIGAYRREASDGSQVMVTVRDEGVGIEPADLEAMFEPFVQGRQTLARSSGGIGMGLTIARQFAALHGGRLTASSAGRGCGTELRLELPMADAALLSPTPPAPAPGETATGDCLDVLVIEDDADAATMLCALLQSLGHTVRMMTDGVSGLDAARDHPPHLAFVDIGLPGLDGYQVASNLRSEVSADEVQLVAVTGYGRPEDRARALEAGFDLHMVKPIDFEQIAHILETRAQALRRGPMAS